MWSSLGLAVGLGVLSSLHCVGMCGPIVWMLPLGKAQGGTRETHLLTYHLGRLSAYTSLGLLFGSLGRGLFIAGWQQELSVVAGVYLLVLAVLPTHWSQKVQGIGPIARWIRHIKTSLGRFFQQKGLTALYLTGFFNGLLPCGMVYAALFGALLQGSVWKAALFMALYGAGTIPLLSSVVYVKQQWANRVPWYKLRWAALLLLGSLFVARGLGLSIPYVSPGLQQLAVQAKPQCH